MVYFGLQSTLITSVCVFVRVCVLMFMFMFMFVLVSLLVLVLVLVLVTDACQTRSRATGLSGAEVSCAVIWWTVRGCWCAEDADEDEVEDTEATSPACVSVTRT